MNGYLLVEAPEAAGYDSPSLVYRLSDRRTQAVVTEVNDSTLSLATNCRLPSNARKLLRTLVVTMWRSEFEHLVACTICWGRLS
jgi:hypothetical protein